MKQPHTISLPCQFQSNSKYFFCNRYSLQNKQCCNCPFFSDHLKKKNNNQEGLETSSLLVLFESYDYEVNVVFFVHSTAFQENTYHCLFRILKSGLSGNIVQTQELPLVISTVCDGFAGYLFAWDFIQENWDRLIEK